MFSKNSGCEPAVMLSKVLETGTKLLLVDRFIWTFIFTILLLLFVPAELLSQIQWSKLPGNPVLPTGPSGSWDETMAGAPSVMFHESIYKMWYEGDGGIGYATSPDGLAWSKHPSNPVLVPGPPGAWDEFDTDCPSVRYVDGTYHMWYSGVDSSNTNRIGHATSPDGLLWTKDPANPVVDLGEDGAWDDEEVMHPYVIVEDSLYRMWYNGHDGITQRILYAYSSDGASWTKYTLHPMLEPGPSGSWDDNELGPLCILAAGNAYHMWYSAWNQAGDIRVGYARSPDGLTWWKDQANSPVLSPGGMDAWDDEIVVLPDVLWNGGRFVMWYSGCDGTLCRTGYAASAVATGAEPSIETETSDRLEQNDPNPLNSSTTIVFFLNEPADVELVIFNDHGRRVRTLVNEKRSGGIHKEVWNSRDDQGSPVSSGIYFYQLKTGTHVFTKKLTLLK